MLPPAHPQQHELITILDRDPKVRFVVGACGSKWGKTFGCSIAMIYQAWNNPGSLNWWIAPSYDQATNAYNLILTMLPDNMYRERKSDLAIDILNPSGEIHSIIVFKSGDKPGSLRGFAVNFFIMDEAALCKEDALVSVMTTLTQTKGKGIFISTPKGRNWFYDAYQKGEKRDEFGMPLYPDGKGDLFPEWFSIRMPTWMNPHVGLKEVYDFKKNMPQAVFMQEIGAQFLTESAGVFRGIKNCINYERNKFENPQPGHRYVMGVDLARIHDFTVITVADTIDNHVVYFERFNQIPWEVQYHKIITMSRRYNQAEAFMDSTGIGDPIVESIERGGVKVTPYKIGTNQQKKQLIDKLRIALENRKITYPHVPMLIKELEAYEYEISDGGVVKYSSPSGIHDDCVMSLALVNWGLQEDPFIYRYHSQRGI